MSKKTKQARKARRAAHARQTGRSTSSTSSTSSGRPDAGRRATPSLGELVAMAVYAVAARPGDVTWLVERLTTRAAAPGGTDQLAGVLADRLARTLGDRWEQGWQPADLVHVIGRRLRVPHRRVAAAAVVLDARTYRHAADADPAWLAQVDAVAAAWAGAGGGRAGGAAGRPGAAVAAGTGGASDPLGVLDRLDPSDLLGLHDRHDRHGPIVTVLETIAELVALPPQPRLCRPPSEWGREPRPGRTGAGASSGAPGPPSGGRPRAGTGAPDPKITERVRALLAKAESTDFPEEAEAFTAKAQELIARHAIDLALLEGSADGAPRAHGRRVLIDDPYGTAKALLLGAIARANGCRTVRSKGLGICTVFGTPGDVDAVELLYTSLLTQATAAMVAAGRAGARARSRGFRRSFLVAYADRIGERLQGATSAAVDEARARHGDDNVLPVLASRETAAEEACAQAFPRLQTERVTTSDAQGWVAGRAAAELAHLGPTTALRAG